MSSQNEFAELASMLEGTAVCVQGAQKCKHCTFLGAAALNQSLRFLKPHLLFTTNLVMVIKKTSLFSILRLLFDLMVVPGLLC